MESSRRPPIHLVVPLTVLAVVPIFSTFSLGKLLAAALYLAVVLWLRRTRIGHISGPLWLYIGYLTVSLPGYLRTPAPAEALQAAALDWAGLGILLATGFATRTVRKELATTLSLALAIVFGIWALEVWSTPEISLLGVLPGSSTLGNPDFVAELGAASIPLLAYAFWQCRNRLWQQIWVGLGMATSLLLALLAGSTTAWVASGVVMFIALGAVVWRIRKEVAIAFLVVVAIAAGVALFASTTVVERLAPRWYLYEVQMEAISESPWLGSGIGGFGNSFLDAQGEHLSIAGDDRSLWTHARRGHNWLLHEWVERGVAPVLLLALFWFWSLWESWRRRKEVGLEGLTLLGLLVLASGSVTWHLAPFRLWMMVCAGWIWARPAQDSSLFVTKHLGLWIWSFLLALLVGVSALAVSDGLRTSGRPEEAIEVFPWHSPVQFDTGWREMALGNPGRACEHFARAHDLAPSLNTAMALGSCAGAQGDWVIAERHYQQAIKWKPDFAAAFANLAVACFRQQRPQDAARYIKRAMSLRPSDPDIVRIREQVCRDNPHCNVRGPIRD